MKYRTATDFIELFYMGKTFLNIMISTSWWMERKTVILQCWSFSFCRNIVFDFWKDFWFRQKG